MRINECSIGISRLKWNVIKSYEGLLGDTTKFPHDEAAGVTDWQNSIHRIWQSRFR